MRCIVDTNVFVSAVILPLSVPRQAVNKALNQDILLLSAITYSELKEVLFRAKLDPYVSREARSVFLAQLETVADIVPIVQVVRECRDPKDDNLLEVALNGRADVIVTEDADLLAMHPWRNIAIVSPADYLRKE